MPQELNTKMMEPLKNADLVRPFEKVTVYATKSPFTKEGEEMEVHPLLAAKLIASKKATKDAPKAKEAK